MTRGRGPKDTLPAVVRATPTACGTALRDQTEKCDGTSPPLKNDSFPKTSPVSLPPPLVDLEMPVLCGVLGYMRYSLRG